MAPEAGHCPCATSISASAGPGASSCAAPTVRRWGCAASIRRSRRPSGSSPPSRSTTTRANRSTRWSSRRTTGRRQSGPQFSTHRKRLATQCSNRAWRTAPPRPTTVSPSTCGPRSGDMLLEGKNAIIYGAGGGIGGGVARTFAREGATVFLVGRTRESLAAVAADIAAAGGSAEVTVVDALDEQAVDEHARAVASEAGSIDVSFNLISRGDVQGIPLVDLTAADFARAVTTGLTSQFLTARAAARRMTEQGSGVILSLTSGSARGSSPMMGNTGPADAAVEAFMRYLAAEVGPHGVRVLGLYTAGVPETRTPEKLASVNSGMELDAAGVERLVEGLAQMTMLRRAPRLAQVAEVAAFLASDRAAGMTGTITNVTCGLVPG